MSKAFFMGMIRAICKKELTHRYIEKRGQIALFSMCSFPDYVSMCCKIILLHLAAQ